MELLTSVYPHDAARRAPGAECARPGTIVPERDMLAAP